MTIWWKIKWYLRGGRIRTGRQIITTATIIMYRIDTASQIRIKEKPFPARDSRKFTTTNKNSRLDMIIILRRVVLKRVILTLAAKVTNKLLIKI